MENKTIKTCLFVRVSTPEQTFDRQIYDLKDICQKRSWEVVKIFSEKVSGGKKTEERPVLKELLEFIEENEINKVCVTEISRLGRNLLEVLKTLEFLHQNKVSLYIQQYDMETLTEYGTENPIVKMMLVMMESFAVSEREALKTRMKSGYNHYRAKGGSVGRKIGYKKKTEKYIEEYPEVIKYLKKNKKFSLRQISKLCDVSVGTVLKIKKTLISDEIITNVK